MPQPDNPTRGAVPRSGLLPQGRSWFLGIGINNYEHFSRLNNARKDVEDMLRLLEERYQLDEHITLLDEAANRQAIVEQLDGLQHLVKENDKLIIFFSGQGHLDKKERGYWLPVDAAPSRPSSFIRSATVQKCVKGLEARHILLISDSCFSGALLTRDVNYARATLEELERGRSRWVISSRREEEADGLPGKNSPFTGSILKVLRNNQQARLKASLLFGQARKFIQFKYKQVPQCAPLFGAGHEGGQYVFHLRQVASAWQTAWATVESLPEETIAQLNAKILRLIEYAGQYSSAENISQALTLREQLKHKLELWQRAEESKEGLTAQPQFKHSNTQTPEHSNTFTDPRDGHVYRTVELNGLRWMAQNLNYDVGEGCWFNENNPKNGEKHGRLYTWEAAKKACPPGWRLPKDEEWKSLAIAFGGYDDFETGNDVGDRRQAYPALLEGGSSGFSALLSGARYGDGTFGAPGDFGAYWSALEYDSDCAWYYEFIGGAYRQLWRRNYYKTFAYSCRCVQAAPSNGLD